MTFDDSDGTKIDESNSKEIPSKSHFSGIRFCWNCGANILNINDIKCYKCRAPLREEDKEIVMMRTEPITTKCWDCKGTTSGNVCGICGAPLTKLGLLSIKEITEVPVREIAHAVQVIAPQLKDVKNIDTTLEELNEIVAQYVKITDSQIVEGAGPRIVIQKPENEKVVLHNLRNDSFFIENNLKVLIRNETVTPGNKQVVLRFYYWKPESTKEQYHIKKIGWNIGLYIVTFVTVSLAGWTFMREMIATYQFQSNMALDITLFTISLMAILTIHELGHFSISKLKKIDVSLPYFIPVPSFPGFATLGTFGALIRQKEPIATRDDLFDIGISGPLAGFLVTIPIFIIGLKLTYVVDIPATPIDPTTALSAPTILLSDILVAFGFATGIIPYYDVTTQMAVGHPVMFAGQIGLILTGLNLMPVGQLDGGHTSRAVFGELPHRFISLGVGLLLVLNPSTRIFGILVLIMGMFQGHPGSVDDVSKVHWSKYVYISIGYAIGILCLPLPITEIQTLFGG
ncbi:MAG: site-2 protease family protein [Candidatus Thorarchaeota archaeon]